MALHPFADLTESEIEYAREIIQAQHPRTLLSFKAITLEEPDKILMLKYLEGEHAGVARPRPDRIAYCAYYFRGTVRSSHQVVELAIFLTLSLRLSS